MFQSLKPQPDDPLLALIGLFRDDLRGGKLDLGIGVYRDERGVTPVMQAVKAAERILLERQQTKAYLCPEGDPCFVDLLASVVFGAPAPLGVPLARLVGVQTPGGSGALRLGTELIATARPGATIWLGTPTWSNHRPIFEALGLAVAEYRHFDLVEQSLRFEDTLAALSGAKAGDVVLLQGCCHNPTGADLDEGQWDKLAGLMAERGLVPFIDLAYQGLGQGLDADAKGAHRILAGAEEALLAYSCDKNFGLYRERTGALFALARDADAASAVRGNLLALARVNWSMPPDHGAAVVRAVLESDELGSMWRNELTGMCRRINEVREVLAAADPGLAFLARQRGMFSQLSISAPAVAELRHGHGVYMAANGRINLAGLRIADVGTLVGALSAVGALPHARRLDR